MQTAFKQCPVSMLQARAKEAEWERIQSLHEDDRVGQAENMAVVERLGWENILPEFRIKGVMSWSSTKAPFEIMAQLIGQTIDTGMIVSWRGQKYLVVDLDVQPQELFRRFTDGDLTAYRGRPITIAPLKYFDLKS